MLDAKLHSCLIILHDVGYLQLQLWFKMVETVAEVLWQICTLQALFLEEIAKIANAVCNHMFLRYHACDISF